MPNIQHFRTAILPRRGLVLRRTMAALPQLE
jgi:hypothetical protein